MIKKTKLLSIILGMSGLVTIASTSAIALSSCSTTNNSTAIPQVSTATFNPLKESINKNANQNTLLEVDPNTNKDAFEQGYSILEQMNTQTWQSEFDKSLTKFYKAYEFEAKIKKPKKSNKVEVESEVKRINVIDVIRDSNKKNIKLTLDVTYEVEIESNKEDKKELKTVQKQVTFSPSFATLPELENIAKQLKELDKNDSGNKYVDFDDILELYVGDLKDNKSSIFEQVYNLASNLKFGGLLGVQVNISDLEYNPLETTFATTDVANGVMFAPILSSSKFFQPAIDKSALKKLTNEEFAILKPIINKIDISYDKLSLITKQQFIDGFKILSPTLPDVGGDSNNNQPVNPDDSNNNGSVDGSQNNASPDNNQNQPIANQSNSSVPPSDSSNDQNQDSSQDKPTSPVEPIPITIPSYVSYINKILMKPLTNEELQYIRVIYVDTTSSSKTKNVTIVLTTKPGTFNSKELLEGEKLVSLQFEYLDNWFKSTTTNSNK